MKSLPEIAPKVTNARYSYFGKDSQSGTGLKVVLAGRETCLEEYRVQRSGFSGYGLEFVAEGVGEVTLDGKSFPLFPGVMFCYGPRTRHEITTNRERRMTKYFIDFSGREIPALLQRHRLPPGSAVQSADLEGCRSYCEEILRHGEQDREWAGEGAGYCLRLLILKARESFPPVRESAATVSYSRWRAFIDANYATLHNLEEIARKLQTRPSQMCRVFQQLGQPSPFQYLTRKKMNRAVELLVSEGCTVQRAAYEVGYEDPYHFSRVFKGHFGHSPANFLKILERKQTARL